MGHLGNVEGIAGRKMCTVYSEGSNQEPGCYHPGGRTHDLSMVTNGNSLSRGNGLTGERGWGARMGPLIREPQEKREHLRVFIEGT